MVLLCEADSGLKDGGYADGAVGVRVAAISSEERFEVPSGRVTGGIGQRRFESRCWGRGGQYKIHGAGLP
jgi:hypothetical protein